MKTPNENKAIDYKDMKDTVLKAGFKQTISGSVSKDKVWGRPGNFGPYTLTGAYSIVQADKPAPKKEVKKIKKAKEADE